MSRTFHRSAPTAARTVRKPRVTSLNPRGIELARELSRYLGTTPEITRLCSQIATLADEYQTIAVEECNRPLTTREIERTPEIESAIRDLVACLPRTDDGALSVRFDGDPRGYVVKIHVPNQEHMGNTWGMGGDYGIGAYLGRD